MRPEAKQWYDQGQADLRAAEQMLSGGIYFAAAFHAHQAAERHLKACVIDLLREVPPRTHNLLELGRRVDTPEAIMDHLRRLNPEYVVSRYPDAANGTPADNYDEARARELVEAAREVSEWAGSVLTEQS